MFIIIIGTRAAGKSTLKDYLINRQGFTLVRIVTSFAEDDKRHNDDMGFNTPSNTRDRDKIDQVGVKLGNVSLDGLKEPTATYVSESLETTTHLTPSTQPAVFSDSADLLLYVTRNWLGNFVTTDIVSRDVLKLFSKRPFVLIINVDAPVLTRYRRHKSQHNALTLDEFVEDYDRCIYGEGGIASTMHHGINPLCHLHVLNPYGSIPEFHSHLESLYLLNSDRLRPGWDTYFMTLASLASRRSNCMKRRVGAILVRNNRIVSTGYNGTPRGVRNCNEGGCPRCNETSASEAFDECVCLHAEENALLEVGRERVGDNAVLYCNTCPCLKCTIKIIQTGVKEVVYNLSYKMDTASASLFLDAGVKFRQYSPSK